MLPILYETDNQPTEKRYWVQCENCELYLDTNELNFLTILRNYPGPISDSTNWTCNSCKEKTSLLAQLDYMNNTIKHLNNTILVLNRRVASLQTINALEREVDESIDDLAAQLSSLHVSHTDKSTINNSSITFKQVHSVEADVDVPLDNTIDNTSIWTGSESNSINQPFDTISNDNTLADTESLINSPIRIETPKSLLEKPIKTLFFGDSTIKDVNLLGALGNKNECLKISRNGATVKDLSETIEYFVDEVYGPSNICTVILQTCIKDMKYGLTENIIQVFENLKEKMEERQISLIIVGPLPFMNLSCSAFSRACCINDWLKKHTTDAENTKFVDIFDHFWNNRSQFNRNQGLNSVGQTNLTNFITEKCLMSAADNI